MPVPPGLSPKDSNQVLRAVMDDDNNRLRVEAEITAVVTDLEIRAASGDNISITNADGTDPLVINPDGSINAVITGGNLAVEVNAADGDNIAISDGTDTLNVNPDGSINVIVSPVGVLTNYYNEVLSVASGVLTLIQTYTVITATASLYYVDVSGTNIATYTVILNGTILMKKRTYFSGEFNENFDFSVGLKLVTGDVIQVKVIHNRPTVGDFNSRILVAEA